MPSQFNPRQVLACLSQTVVQQPANAKNKEITDSNCSILRSCCVSSPIRASARHTNPKRSPGNFAGHGSSIMAMLDLSMKIISPKFGMVVCQDCPCKKWEPSKDDATPTSEEAIQTRFDFIHAASSHLRPPRLATKAGGGEANLRQSLKKIQGTLKNLFKEAAKGEHQH